jgi:hypothetical protein
MMSGISGTGPSLVLARMKAALSEMEEYPELNRPTLDVVPAQAGTHNYGCQEFCEIEVRLFYRVSAK